jgi:hypothetical protein
VAALHGDAGGRHVGDLDGVVLGGGDRLGEVLADLLAVDVERGDELHVAHVVVTEGLTCIRPGTVWTGRRPVVLHALTSDGRTVADADDGDAGCGRRLTHALEVLLDPGAAALEDAQRARRARCGRRRRTRTSKPSSS